MTTSQSSPVLKDVVAYVDVWSSEKTANFSKPFVQQLQEMGAQVSKTFNKQVTHVIFNNGHLATWRKAKKSNVKLVSVLWVGRCYDDGVHVDEDLYAAINDESNPVLMNKKHRCMQPKDSPERTPENDRRMKKKLDKMMKDRVPKQPLVTDVSPIIIDEESGIIYSPALKRSDYMAKRLKDMKEKRENLSLSESQMVESCSPTELNPSLGSTPTVQKLMFHQEDDSCASVAEPGCLPDKQNGKTQVDATDHGHLEKHHRTGSEKPWLSPCREVHPAAKIISSPLKCPDFDNEEGNRQQKQRRSSVRRKPAEKYTSVGSLENPHQRAKSDNTENFTKEKRQSRIKSSSLSSKISEKGKLHVNETFTETQTTPCPDNVKLSSCLSSPAISRDAAVRLSKDTATPRRRLEQKISKGARPSFSALIRTFTISNESPSIAPVSAEGDDDAFEDYFSPANHHQRSKNRLLSNLSVESDIHIPLELDPVPKKRTARRSEGSGTECSGKKRRKLNESPCGKTQHQQLDSNPQQDVGESVPALDSPSCSLTLVAKRRRQSTLPFTSTSTITTDTLKHRRASEQSVLTGDKPVPEMEKKSEVSVRSHTVESTGNECTVAAGLIEINSEGDVTHSEQMSLSLKKMDSGAKAVRTLVMTSMPTEKQHTVRQVVKALGGFLIVDQVCESTTHVVCGGHRRTLNILLGIARGCWVLSFEWILWCLEQRQWIPEEPYELSDQFPAAQICRLQRHLSAGEHQQDLFLCQPAMFVSHQSQPPMQSLVELIELCGGTVCKTVRQAGICIGKYGGRRPEGSRILSEQWVLDCITHLKLLPYDGYDFK
ncbi:hypothetical protein JOB18_049847 [Solea senegalensis]|uniref:BRCT domain-containing protein n=1 Tax=Solea senegalensis TaxID=28829 RepID=A0AAV6SAU4_SOLSE|nr:microcephalin isoform X1 [Solea senegalensis]KAG7513166.1 hypothetical protein JOB18_049847 [Solea senegalensis]